MTTPETVQRPTLPRVSGALILTFILGGLCGWGIAYRFPPRVAEVCDECGGDGEDGLPWVSGWGPAWVSEKCRVCGGDGMVP